jgi:hypothetical protein
MHMRMPTSALTVVVLASFVAIGCNGDSGTMTATVTGPTAVASLSTATSVASVTAEPTTIPAEAQLTSTCRIDPPFLTRVNITVGPRQDLFIRRFGFELFGPFGRRVRPLVFPESTDVLLPGLLPTTHPIPFPGEARMSSVVAQAGTFVRVPFRLLFDCGTPARGTLAISVETADERGNVSVSRIQAEIR